MQSYSRSAVFDHRYKHSTNGNKSRKKMSMRQQKWKHLSPDAGTLMLCRDLGEYGMFHHTGDNK